MTQSGFAQVNRNVQNGMNTAVNSTNSAAQRISSAFRDVPGSVGRSMNEAVAQVRGAVQQMESAIAGVRFHFNQSIQLPHFAMNGDFNAQTKQVPTVSVRWYAQGGILMAPTIFGALGGHLLGGGEAGPEAVLPLSTLKDYMRDIMDERQGRGTTYTQNITINSPTALSPSEVARQTRIANRRFVLAQRGL